MGGADTGRILFSAGWYGISSLCLRRLDTVLPNFRPGLQSNGRGLGRREVRRLNIYLESINIFVMISR